MTDWLMVIITAIYVVATIVICVFNARSAKAAKEQAAIAQKQMQEMVTQYNSTNRPIMTVRFEIVRSSLLCFIFENVGPLPAESVKIHINDSFVENVLSVNDKLRLKEVTEAELFVASKQKIVVLLAGQKDFEIIASEPAIITISYNSQYVETSTIDINQYAFMMVYSSSEEDISQHLKKIKEQDKQYHKSVVKAIEGLAH